MGCMGEVLRCRKGPRSMQVVSRGRLHDLFWFYEPIHVHACSSCCAKRCCLMCPVLLFMCAYLRQVHCLLNLCGGVQHCNAQTDATDGCERCQILACGCFSCLLLCTARAAVCLPHDSAFACTLSLTSCSVCWLVVLNCQVLARSIHIQRLIG